MPELPIMKKPCKDCPFRKDSLKGWLGKKRIEEILESDSFVCHKTTNTKMIDRKQCAGFMIIKDIESSAIRYAELFEIDLRLSGHELIFDTKQDCITHHTI